MQAPISENTLDSETALAASRSDRASAKALEAPLTDFFPSGSVDLDRSANRLKGKAEAMSILRGLTDRQLTVALAQIKAVGDVKLVRVATLYLEAISINCYTANILELNVKPVIVHWRDFRNSGTTNPSPVFQTHRL